MLTSWGLHSTPSEPLVSGDRDQDQSDYMYPVYLSPPIYLTSKQVLVTNLSRQESLSRWNREFHDYTVDSDLGPLCSCLGHCLSAVQHLTTYTNFFRACGGIRTPS